MRRSPWKVPTELNGHLATATNFYAAKIYLFFSPMALSKTSSRQGSVSSCNEEVKFLLQRCFNTADNQIYIVRNITTNVYVYIAYIFYIHTNSLLNERPAYKTIRVNTVIILIMQHILPNIFIFNGSHFNSSEALN